MQHLVRAAGALLIAALGTSCSSVVDSRSKNSFTATLDNSAWSAAAVTAATDGTVLLIYETPGSAVPHENIVLQFNLTATGDQALGTQASGRYGQVTSASASDIWQSGVAGAAGVVTITSRTSTHIVGTFHFDAGLTTPGSVAATRHVTSGSFDVTF